MGEPTLIYVNRITNLSDARYCAGMGVDFLGFVIDPASPDYVSPELFQDLVGWISGPARVLELGHAAFDRSTIAERYAADFLHIPEDRLNEFDDIDIKLIAEASPTSGNLQGKQKAPVAYWAVHSLVEPLENVNAPYLVFGNPADQPVKQYLNALGAKGIILSGSKETAPGLKDYDTLSAVLEELNG